AQGGWAILNHSCRSALAVPKPHGQGRSRAQALAEISNDGVAGDHGASRRKNRRCAVTSLSLGPKRTPSGGASSDGRLGLHLQDERCLVQGAKGRRSRWPWRGLLFPK